VGLTPTRPSATGRRATDADRRRRARRASHRATPGHPPACRIDLRVRHEGPTRSAGARLQTSSRSAATRPGPNTTGCSHRSTPRSANSSHPRPPCPEVVPAVLPEPWMESDRRGRIPFRGSAGSEVGAPSRRLGWVRPPSISRILARSGRAGRRAQVEDAERDVERLPSRRRGCPPPSRSAIRRPVRPYSSALVSVDTTPIAFTRIRGESLRHELREVGERALAVP